MKRWIQLFILTVVLLLPTLTITQAKETVWGYFQFQNIETEQSLNEDLQLRLYDMKGKLLTEKFLPAKDSYGIRSEELYDFEYDKEYLLEMELLNFKKVQQPVRFTKGTQAQQVVVYAEPLFGELEIYTPTANQSAQATVEFYNLQGELVRTVDLSTVLSVFARATISLPPNTYTMKLISASEGYMDIFRVMEKEVTILPGVKKSAVIHSNKAYSEVTVGMDYELLDESGFRIYDRFVQDGKYSINTFPTWEQDLAESYMMETSTIPNARHYFNYQVGETAAIELYFSGYDSLKQASVTLKDETGKIIDTKQGNPYVAFTNLAVGKYTLDALVDNEQSFHYEATISHPKEQIYGEQHVYAPTATVSFKALNRDNIQKIISTGEVAITANGKKIRAVLNNKNEFMLYNVPVGVHQFTVEVPGFKKIEKELVVAYGEGLQIKQLLIEDHPYYASHKLWPSTPTVDAEKVWSIAFSDALNERTVTEQTVFVTDGNGIRQPNIKLSVIDDGKKLVVENETGYESGRKYVIHITNGVRSKSGKPLQNTQFVFYVK